MFVMCTGLIFAVAHTYSGATKSVAPGGKTLNGAPTPSPPPSSLPFPPLPIPPLPSPPFPSLPSLRSRPP